jgi:hypothetical protein
MTCGVKQDLLFVLYKQVQGFLCTNVPSLKAFSLKSRAVIARFREG